jgi:hypothetical protein
VAGVGLHRAGGDLALEGLVGTDQQLLAGLAAGVMSPMFVVNRAQPSLCVCADPFDMPFKEKSTVFPARAEQEAVNRA